MCCILWSTVSGWSEDQCAWSVFKAPDFDARHVSCTMHGCRGRRACLRCDVPVVVLSTSSATAATIILSRCSIRHMAFFAEKKHVLAAHAFVCLLPATFS